jgi:hypothetical protein
VVSFLWMRVFALSNREELEQMKKGGVGAEIEALATQGLGFLQFTFLPWKLSKFGIEIQKRKRAPYENTGSCAPPSPCT